MENLIKKGFNFYAPVFDVILSEEDTKHVLTIYKNASYLSKEERIRQVDEAIKEYADAFIKESNMNLTLDGYWVDPVNKIIAVRFINNDLPPYKTAEQLYTAEKDRDVSFEFSSLHDDLVTLRTRPKNSDAELFDKKPSVKSSYFKRAQKEEEEEKEDEEYREYRKLKRKFREFLKTLDIERLKEIRDEIVKTETLKKAQEEEEIGIEREIGVETENEIINEIIDYLDTLPMDEAKDIISEYVEAEGEEMEVPIEFEEREREREREEEITPPETLLEASLVKRFESLKNIWLNELTNSQKAKVAAKILKKLNKINEKEYYEILKKAEELEEKERAEVKIDEIDTEKIEKTIQKAVDVLEEELGIDVASSMLKNAIKTAANKNIGYDPVTDTYYGKPEGEPTFAQEKKAPFYEKGEPKEVTHAREEVAKLAFRIIEKLEERGEILPEEKVQKFAELYQKSKDELKQILKKLETNEYAILTDDGEVINLDDLFK